MKRFILIYHGHEQPTAEIAAAWNDWFCRRAKSFVEVNHVFGPGRQITDDGTIEWSLATNQASGYSIVAAPHIDAAEQLLEGCPIVDSVSLYEVEPAPDRPSHPAPMGHGRRGDR